MPPCPPVSLALSPPRSLPHAHIRRAAVSNPTWSGTARRAAEAAPRRPARTPAPRTCQNPVTHPSRRPRRRRRGARGRLRFGGAAEPGPDQASRPSPGNLASRFVCSGCAAAPASRAVARPRVKAQGVALPFPSDSRQTPLTHRAAKNSVLCCAGLCRAGLCCAGLCCAGLSLCLSGLSLCRFGLCCFGLCRSVLSLCLSGLSLCCAGLCCFGLCCAGLCRGRCDARRTRPARRGRPGSAAGPLPPPPPPPPPPLV